MVHNKEDLALKKAEIMFDGFLWIYIIPTLTEVLFKWKSKGWGEKRGIVMNEVLKSIRPDLTSTVSSFVILRKMLNHGKHLFPMLFTVMYAMMVNKHLKLSMSKTEVLLFFRDSSSYGLPHVNQ